MNFQPTDYTPDPNGWGNDIRENERHHAQKRYCVICGNETTGGYKCQFCWDELPPKPAKDKAERGMGK
jgi:hypothetical protein